MIGTKEPRIAVVAALRWECRPVVRALRQVSRSKLEGSTLWRGRSGTGEVWVMQAGVGIERAERATRRLLAETQFDACLSVGCAGALATDLPIGALVIANQIIEAGHSFATDTSLRTQLEALAARYRATTGDFLCSPKVLCTVAGKSEARARTGALAVEMEGSGIARAAAAAGVPFGAVRAVLDSADTELPESGDWMNPDSGRLDWRELARTLVRKPLTVRHFAGMRNGMNAAERSLERFFASYLATGGGNECPI